MVNACFPRESRSPAPPEVRRHGGNDEIRRVVSEALRKSPSLTPAQVDKIADGLVRIYEFGQRSPLPGVEPTFYPPPPGDEPLRAVGGYRDNPRTEPAATKPPGRWTRLVRWLRRLFVDGPWLMALALCLTLTACAGWQPPPPAQLVATAANRALPVLVAFEERDADRDGIDAAEKAWKPFWDAWEVFRRAQSAWASAVEQGASGVEQLEAAARAALCAARGALPGGVPPDVLTMEVMLCS